MNLYIYYAIDCNKLKKRLQKQNESNAGLELELKATKAQFEDVFDYLKKENRRVKRLKTIINQLIVVKTKSDTVFLSVENHTNTSRYFVHALFFVTNKSQLTSSICQELSNTPYVDQRKYISTTTRFSSKKSFPDSPIFTDGKDTMIEQWLSKIQNKLKLN